MAATRWLCTLLSTTGNFNGSFATGTGYSSGKHTWIASTYKNSLKLLKRKKKKINLNGKGTNIYDFCMIKGDHKVAHMVDSYQDSTV